MRGGEAMEADHGGGFGGGLEVAPEVLGDAAQPDRGEEVDREPGIGLDALDWIRWDWIELNMLV